MALKATWYGHAVVGIETRQVRVLIDPFFTDNPLSPVGPEDQEVDVICVTHGHGDHLGDTVPIAKRTGALVISNFEIATYLQGQGIEKVHPLHIGGGFSFEWGRVKLTPALHGSALPDGSYGGMAAGILLDLGGIRIYHAGDTGLFSDMKLIGQGGLDLAFLPIGDNFTMGPEDAVQAVSFLRPRRVVPMHYGTFDVIQQDPVEWAQQVTKATGVEVSILQPGESLEL